MKPMAEVSLKTLIALLKRLKSGGLTVKLKNTNIIELNIADREIAIDIQSLDTAKEFIDPLRKTQFSFSREEKQEEKLILEKLKMIKDFAENLKNEKLTISIKSIGEPVLVIGEKAKPRLSRLILGSNIQADIIKIISLIAS